MPLVPGALTLVASSLTAKDGFSDRSSQPFRPATGLEPDAGLACRLGYPGTPRQARGEEGGPGIG